MESRQTAPSVIHHRDTMMPLVHTVHRRHLLRTTLFINIYPLLMHNAQSRSLRWCSEGVNKSVHSTSILTALLWCMVDNAAEVLNEKSCCEVMPLSSGPEWVCPRARYWSEAKINPTCSLLSDWYQWKVRMQRLPYYWTFVRGIHRCPVDTVDRRVFLTKGH